MKRILPLATLASAILLAACASTQQAESTAEKDPEAVSCRRVKEMGSNLGERVCMTVAEWEAYDDANKSEAEEFRRRVNQTPGGGVGSGGGIGR